MLKYFAIFAILQAAGVLAVTTEAPGTTSAGASTAGLDCDTFFFEEEDVTAFGCVLERNSTQTDACCNSMCSPLAACKEDALVNLLVFPRIADVVTTCAGPQGNDRRRMATPNQDCADLIEFRKTNSASFGPQCEDFDDCARGPSRPRPAISGSTAALVNNGVFLRPFQGSGGIVNSYVMTFGLTSPREVKFPDITVDVPAIPLYVDLVLEMPSAITEATGTANNKVFMEEYFELQYATSLYGFNKNSSDDCECYFDGPLFGGDCSCQLDTAFPWTATATFDNLRDRTSLATTREDFVDCSNGWCGELLPDVTMIKRTSYFAGTFKQDYQLNTFPFDTQVFWFNFSINAPYGLVELNSSDSTLAIDHVAAGFHFTEMRCFHKVLGEVWGGSCRVQGTRLYAPTLLNLIIPSLLFVFVAVCSLLLDVNKSMPRVAMTMFSLLVITQLRNQIIARLPSSEDFVWVDLFLFCCILIVILIMFSHVMSEKLAHDGKKDIQILFDRLGYRTIPALLGVLVLMISMVSSGVSSAVYVPISIFLVALVLGIGGFFYVKERRQLTKYRSQKIVVDFEEGMQMNDYSSTKPQTPVKRISTTRRP